MHKAQSLLIFAVSSLLLIAIACTPGTPDTTQENTAGNPALPGFDSLHSDAKAIAIADEVMEAMGGRKNWDETRYISWDFFGRRRLLWDKWTGDVRIDANNGDYSMIVNIHTLEGQARDSSVVVTQPDSLKKRMDKALEIWINDSYWLVMPFKLKDSGVTLTYVGEDSTEAGEPADLLELRFKEVGLYPQHKYRVWVNQHHHLITQWAYYPEASLEEPRFITPWNNYQPHGNILLSDQRGESRILGNLAVKDSIDRILLQQL